MAEGAHDTGTLSAVSTTLMNTDGLVGAPFSFYFGVPPRTELFQGYITEVTDTQGATGQLSFTLTVMGPTKLMFEGKPRFWRNKSVTESISDLVSANYLGRGGHHHEHKWVSLAQTDESDWEMINTLAKRIGWIIYSRYGVVYPCDPLYCFKSFGSYTRLVSSQVDPLTTDKTMIEFTSEVISNVVQDSLGWRFGFFTSGDEPQIMGQTGDFAGYLFKSDQVVRDQVEAATYTAARDVRLESWSEAGVARIWGDADIYPGMCVDVVTARQKYLAPKSDGRWLVRAVGHQANPQQFQTILMLSRPSAATLAIPMYESQVYKPFWELEDPARPRPSLTLADGKWLSSWRIPPAVVA